MRLFIIIFISLVSVALDASEASQDTPISNQDELKSQWLIGPYYKCKKIKNETYDYFYIRQITRSQAEELGVHDFDLVTSWYMYFFYANYPTPIFYAHIVKETSDKIFMLGEHHHNTDSNIYEPFSAALDKKSLVLELTNFNYRGEIMKFQTQCGKMSDEITN